MKDGQRIHQIQLLVILQSNGGTQFFSIFNNYFGSFYYDYILFVNVDMLLSSTQF